MLISATSDTATSSAFWWSWKLVFEIVGGMFITARNFSDSALPKPTALAANTAGSLRNIARSGLTLSQMFLGESSRMSGKVLEQFPTFVAPEETRRHHIFHSNSGVARDFHGWVCFAWKRNL